MPRRYKYATTLAWGGDAPTAEVDVEVSYEVAFGQPETGRFGPPEHYDPGSGDEVHSIRLERVEGKPRPWEMGFGFISDDEFAEMVVEKLEGSDAHLARMIEKANESEASDYDAWQESLAEERRMEARR